MTTLDELVAQVLAAAGGEIVGRIRLQKIFYLLEQVGMKGGLSFRYHHYGPYSRELDDALDRAQALRGVVEDIKHRGSDGMPYSVFKLVNDRQVPKPEALGRLGRTTVERLIGLMKGRSSTVLELAATIHWLSQVEQVADWKGELVRRKGAKTERGRIDQALAVLKELDLSPA
jgi:uncharacterized protein YwgA